MTRSHSICGTKDEKLEKRVEKKTGGGGSKKNCCHSQKKKKKEKEKKGTAPITGL